MRGKKQMKPVQEMLEEKREQLARLQIEIQTLEAALRRANGDPSRRNTARVGLTSSNLSWSCLASAERLA